MAAQWIGGARFVASLTGMSYVSALFIFAVSVLIYVTIGGFRAVALTDAVQGSIMFIGTLILLISVIIAGGGVPSIISDLQDRKSTRLNSSHVAISYAVFCLKKKNI